MYSAEKLLAQCLSHARLYPSLISEAQQHAVFAMSASARGRLRLREAPFSLEPLATEALARWHASMDAGDWMEARLQLLAKHLECRGTQPPARWERAIRIARSRAGVKDPVKAVACVACSVLFDSEDAPLRRVTRADPPYPARARRSCRPLTFSKFLKGAPPRRRCSPSTRWRSTA